MATHGQERSWSWTSRVALSGAKRRAHVCGGLPATVARALGQMTVEVMSPTQWAHAGTSLVIWMVLPLLIGAWRVTRREVTA